jgi:hypothetical protein
MGQDLHWTQAQYDEYLRRHNLPPREPEVIPHPEKVLRHAKAPNKTERDFGLILEAQKRKEEIVRYEYEGVALRLADGCKFTPDYFIIVSISPLKIRFAETKGPHLWEDALVKFKVAKAIHYWAEWELWQKKAGTWSRLF